jgi:rhamnosyltransferase
MSLPQWRTLGGFRADYFIDGVDHELCLRARGGGLIVARHGRVLMQHRIGEKAAGIRLLPYMHPPLRKYYSMRNGVRNIVAYAGSEPLWTARKSATLAWEMIVVMLLEADKWAKLNAMMRGLNDGWRGRMGAAPEDLAG